MQDNIYEVGDIICLIMNLRMNNLLYCRLDKMSLFRPSRDRVFLLSHNFFTFAIA